MNEMFRLLVIICFSALRQQTTVYAGYRALRGHNLAGVAGNPAVVTPSV